MGSKSGGYTHVAVGNLNLDISVVLDEYPLEDSHVFARDSWIGLGGAATNYSVATARLGHKAYLVAKAGGDAVKLGLLDKLASKGVRIEFVQVSASEPVGTVIVLLVPSRGTRTMVTIRGANEKLSGRDVPYVDEANIYHFASVRPAIINTLCSEPWWKSSFIASYDPGGEAYRQPHNVLESLPCIDILMANEREANTIARAGGYASPKELLQEGPRVVVVKRGEGGAVAHTPDSTIEARLLRAPHVIDVTGAGDAFDAAFNAWLLETGSVEIALRAAVSAGAAKVLRRGSANMPSRSEVESAMGGVALRVVAKSG
ncbi:MAG: PfkB family carbohydrate kinase [Desulfurococcales archaeon]|nr:PfkB family carbohydrate kinase [Desulfurococcales archaeon]